MIEELKVYDPEALGLDVSKVVGEEAIVHCPYHDDSKPSASYNMVKGVFYCFGCHEKKTTEELAIDLGGTLVVAGEGYFEKWGSPLSDSEWMNLLKNPLAIGNEYLTNRLVSEEQIIRHEIREYGDGIIVPMKDKFGNVKGVQVRHYEKQPKYKFYGEKQPVWPIENIGKRGNLFITEGVFGTLRGELIGANTIASFGTSNVLTVYDYLERQNYQNAYTVFDNDFAGLVAAGKFMILEIPAILSFGSFAPKGDPDEWFPAEWETVKHYAHQIAINDVQFLIDRCSDPLKMYNLLNNFWRNL